MQSRSDEPSVRAVVSKVRLGVADAGIVYATDVRATGSKGYVLDETKIHRVTIPEQHNIRTLYPIAALSTGNQGALGEAFVAFVVGPVGQAILASHGFGKP